MIDSELSWKHHIDFICHKISRSVGIIAKMRHYIPRHLLLNLYHALIAPYLNYGICAWSNCPQTHLNKILVLQKRALRLIYFSKPRDHAIPFFIESNCLPLQSLFFQQLSYLMYDVHAKTAPKSLLDKFCEKQYKTSLYYTRLSAKECFSVKFSRTEEMKKSFTRIGVSIWNSIRLSVKTLNISNYWAACGKPSNKIGIGFSFWHKSHSGVFSACARYKCMRRLA